MVEFSAEDEEVVAQTVDVSEQVFFYWLACFGESYDGSFCSAADGAADVCLCTLRCALWQDEAAEGRELVLNAVDFCFQLFGGIRAYLSALRHGLGVGGEVGSDDEELALYGAQECFVGCVWAEGYEQPQV
mgnify:CR=1 FL=1